MACICGLNGGENRIDNYQHAHGCRNDMTRVSNVRRIVREELQKFQELKEAKE